jgi:uncharacterized protein YndB with AHSA1/START domain
MTDLSVNITKIVMAPIAKVFDAWLDPAMLSQFILPMPGMASPEVENDPRSGGAFTIIMHVGSDKIPHTGTYLTIERPTKLVFSWQSPVSTDDSVVTLDFTAMGENQTRVELQHVRFIDEERRSNHEGGWGNILDTLDDVIRLGTVSDVV